MSTDSNTTMPAVALEAHALLFGVPVIRLYDAQAALSASESRVQALQREVEELRADAERLEWLVCRLSDKEARRLGIYTGSGGRLWTRVGIDAAIRASKAEVAKDGPVPVGLICERVALRRLLDDVDSLPLHAHKRKVIREWIESAMASIKAEVPND